MEKAFFNTNNVDWSPFIVLIKNDFIIWVLSEQLVTDFRKIILVVNKRIYLILKPLIYFFIWIIFLCKVI